MVKTKTARQILSPRRLITLAWEIVCVTNITLVNIWELSPVSILDSKRLEPMNRFLGVRFLRKSFAGEGQTALKYQAQRKKYRTPNVRSSCFPWSLPHAREPFGRRRGSRDERSLLGATQYQLLGAGAIVAGLSPARPHCWTIYAPGLVLGITYQSPLEGLHTAKSAFPSPS
jgi:hypothetical protein